MRCCKHYNDHYPFMHGKKEFRQGDKICCRKNCSIPILSDKRNDKTKGGDDSLSAKGPTPEGGKNIYFEESGDKFVDGEMSHNSISDRTETTELMAKSSKSVNEDDFWRENKLRRLDQTSTDSRPEEKNSLMERYSR